MYHLGYALRIQRWCNGSTCVDRVSATKRSTHIGRDIRLNYLLVHAHVVSKGEACQLERLRAHSNESGVPWRGKRLTSESMRVLGVEQQRVRCTLERVSVTRQYLTALKQWPERAEKRM